MLPVAAAPLHGSLTDEGLGEMCHKIGSNIRLSSIDVMATDGELHSIMMQSVPDIVSEQFDTGAVPPTPPPLSLGGGREVRGGVRGQGPLLLNSAMLIPAYSHAHSMHSVFGQSPWACWRNH